MIVDFLKLLSKSHAKYAFVATYEFDPLFFERRILTTKSFERAERIVVFVDDGRYREILASGRQGAFFDRRYFVVPMRRPGGVFHPKLYLCLGEKISLATIGSNNCTASGTGHNFELVSGFKVTNEDADLSLNARLISSVFNLFRLYGSQSGPLAACLEEEVFREAERLCPWLAGAPRPQDGDNVELLFNHDTPLWPQLVARLNGKEVKKITLMAPFFDRRLSIVERVRSVWPASKIEIIAQSGYSNLPAQRFSELASEPGNLKLFSAKSDVAGRSMHAKALTFETAEGTYWLTGSANISHSALIGGNSEACLWISTRQRTKKVLAHEDFKIVPIDPADFHEGECDEPGPQEDAAGGLRLYSVLLDDDGCLRAQLETPEGLEGCWLELRKRSEIHPFLSIPVGAGNSSFAVQVAEEQRKLFDQPVVGRLKATLAGVDVESSPASLVQLPQLLRDRDGLPSTVNRLQRMTETGEGIVEYIDSLGSMDEAIVFFNSVSIRFDDGFTGGTHRGGAWRARDPFSGDVPDSWTLGSQGVSVEDLRVAVWNFARRHIDGPLRRHEVRGNVNGLPNFLDVFRTISQVLFSYHGRKIDGQIVIPHPYVTAAMQEMIALLIGKRDENEFEQTGFVASVASKLGGKVDILRKELARQRCPATIMAAVDAMIRVRATALGQPILDGWSTKRHHWVRGWVAAMNLDFPDEQEIEESASEFRLAA